MLIDRGFGDETLVDDEVVVVRGILQHVKSPVSRLVPGAFEIDAEHLQKIGNPSRLDPDVNELHEHPRTFFI
jgi:hypothetical protein